MDIFVIILVTVILKEVLFILIMLLNEVYFSWKFIGGRPIYVQIKMRQW